eukprot:1157349-Pelagomonas_calceolata.AAC.10
MALVHAGVGYHAAAFQMDRGVVIGGSLVLHARPEKESCASTRAAVQVHRSQLVGVLDVGLAALIHILKVGFLELAAAAVLHLWDCEHACVCAMSTLMLNQGEVASNACQASGTQLRCSQQLMCPTLCMLGVSSESVCDGAHMLAGNPIQSKHKHHNMHKQLLSSREVTLHQGPSNATGHRATDKSWSDDARCSCVQQVQEARHAPLRSGAQAQTRKCPSSTPAAATMLHAELSGGFEHHRCAVAAGCLNYQGKECQSCKQQGRHVINSTVLLWEGGAEAAPSLFTSTHPFWQCTVHILCVGKGAVQIMHIVVLMLEFSACILLLQWRNSGRKNVFSTCILTTVVSSSTKHPKVKDMCGLAGAGVCAGALRILWSTELRRNPDEF